MPRLKELEHWMTTGQAADRLGWSRQGVINLATSRRVKAVQVGAAHDTGRPAWIFDPESVEAFARGQEYGE